MLTTTAMNKLRTIGFSQADFQIIAEILSETTNPGNSDVISHKEVESIAGQISKSDIADLVGFQVRSTRHPKSERNQKSLTAVRGRA